MRFSALRYFHETARTGSIRRASERLHVAPSAISRQIANLEHDFGAPLFERGSQGVTLTAAGELLASHTQRMFREFDRVRASIDDLRELRRGEVTLWVMEGVVAEVLPNLLFEFHARYPKIQLNIQTAPTDRIVEAVISDEADIGITFNAPDRAELVAAADYIEPVDCLVAPTHPLANRKSVNLADLEEYPLALPEISFGLRQMVDKAVHRRKLQFMVVLNTNSLELTKMLAAAGTAVAFMPALTIRRELADGRLVALTVDEPEFRAARTVVCVHRNRVLPFAARELLRTLVDRLAELNRERDASQRD